jgi:hypothetical protein
MSQEFWAHVADIVEFLFYFKSPLCFILGYSTHTQFQFSLVLKCRLKPLAELSWSIAYFFSLNIEMMMSLRSCLWNDIIWSDLSEHSAHPSFLIITLELSEHSARSSFLFLIISLTQLNLVLPSESSGITHIYFSLIPFINLSDPLNTYSILLNKTVIVLGLISNSCLFNLRHSLAIPSIHQSRRFSLPIVSPSSYPFHSTNSSILTFLYSHWCRSLT